ncbi:MAG TPA: DUF5666 domain-containing protein [Thermoanaerobaculia bacterium]|jgi:hypothetical protein
MKARIASFVLFCLAALTFTSGAQAQVFPRGARGVTGTVSSIEGTAIRLFDNRLTLDASRAIVRSDLGPATLADIKPGDRISAYVFPAVDGALVADMIHILRLPDAALSGEVEAVDAASGVLTVLGLQVRVTSATVLRGLGGEPIALGAVLPHQQVRVELDAASPGLVAKTVLVTSPVPDFTNTFIGTVEKIEGDTWTVRASGATVVVKTTTDTQIVGTPRVGDEVMVTYRTDGAGQNLALSISIVPKMPQRPERPMNGTVTEITATSLTITFPPTNDFATFDITSETQFFGGRPAVGDNVLVFSRPENERNIATRVVRIDSSDENRIFFDGTLHVIDGNKWTIDEHEVIVTERTLITGNPKPGDRVHVIATQPNHPDPALYGIEIAKIGG